MTTLTFKDFLVILESANDDINKLMSDISLIDQQLNQRTQPLLARKAQLQKLMMAKQKQKAAEDKKAASNPQLGQNPGQPHMQANQTSTPGGSGSGTPGSSGAM